MAGCNLCGSTTWTVLEAVGATRVVRCACGLVFVTPVPPRPVLEAAYDEAYYRAWAGQARARARIWRGRVERLLALTGGPGRLLDVGCGTGAFLEVARDRGFAATGTELSTHAAAAARAAGLDVRAGELGEAGLPPAAFDVVTCWHVIEHHPDPRALLGEIHRVLRPGGWLLLATPNLEGWIFRAAYRIGRGRPMPLFEADEREVHLFHFTAETLGRLAAAAGFRDVRIGFDRGAAAVPAKRLVNGLARVWYGLTALNWGIGLELTARRAPEGGR